MPTHPKELPKLKTKVAYLKNDLEVEEPELQTRIGLVD